MCVQEQRAEFDIEARSVGNIRAKHFDHEIFRLDEMAIAAPGAVRMHLRAEPVGAMHRVLPGRKLGSVLLLVELGAYRLADISLG
jgi:hypothetical protein